MGTLRKKEALEMFGERCFYVSSGDVITRDDAVAIVGLEAVEQVLAPGKGRPGKDWNMFGMEGRQLVYLTLEGFMRAVSWYNVAAILEEGGAGSGSGSVVNFRPGEGRRASS